MSTNSDASGMVQLPITKISQSLDIPDEEEHKSKREHKKSKTKKHIDHYFNKQFLEDYFNV